MMNLNKLTKLITAASCIAMSSVAYSDSDTIDATTKWVATVGVTGIQDINIGLIDVVIDNNVHVGVSATGFETDMFNNRTGTLQPGIVTITATAGETLSIGVSAADSATGFDVKDFKCQYNDSGTDSDCDSADNFTVTAVSSDNMEIGGYFYVDRTNETASIVAGGIQSETITVTVDYN